MLNFDGVKVGIYNVDYVPAKKTTRSSKKQYQYASKKSVDMIINYLKENGRSSRIDIIGDLEIGGNVFTKVARQLIEDKVARLIRKINQRDAYELIK